jgi:hypothetical protein
MNNRLGVTREDIDLLADTLSNISLHMSPALMRNLIRELAANQVTSSTKTDFITALQRAYTEVLATRANGDSTGAA